MQSRIICSVEIHNWCKWLDYGEVAMNCMFDCIPHSCKIEQPDTLQRNGMTNSKWECVCGNNFFAKVIRNCFPLR